MKLNGFLIACFLLIGQRTDAQFFNVEEKPFSFEAGISLGPMNAFTDLGGRRGNGQTGAKDFNIKNTKLYGSVYFSTTFLDLFSVRLEATRGGVKSNDSLLENVKGSAIGRYTRNLSFRSAISEVTITLELHPLVLVGSADPDAAVSPYVLGGFGYFHFNPQAMLNGQWIDLRPLHTEGQGFQEFPERREYKLNQLNIPLGAGIRYQLSNAFNFRLEYITRKLNTDYLDDVSTTYIEPALFSKYLSGTNLTNALILNNRVRPNTPSNTTTARPGGQRGDPKDNDHYFTINLKIGYKFGNGGGGSGHDFRSTLDGRPKMGKHLLCPKRF
ncbi:MAG: hypothetical protein ABJA57_01455 [Ginsengibacter sp.]